jgi:hypothetical protein
MSSKNAEPCGGTAVPSLSSSALKNGVATTLPEGEDMAGGGRGGPVIIPDSDNDDARRLLDNAGSTNANDDDNNNAPLPPPKKGGNALQGEGGWDNMVPDNDMTAAVVSRDAVATNAANAVVCWGACDLHAAANDMGGFMIMCLVLYDRWMTIVYGMDCMVSCAFE